MGLSLIFHSLVHIEPWKTVHDKVVRYGRSGLFKVTETGTSRPRKPICDLLLVFHCRPNYMPVFCRFQDIATGRRFYPPQSCLNPSQEGLPSDLGY